MHAWRSAYDAYGAAAQAELTPEDLELYADAAWWTGKIEEAIALRERAYAGFTAAADRRSAARMALTLNWDHAGRKAFAVAGGWFGNAERLPPTSPTAASTASSSSLAASARYIGGGNIQEGLASLERAVEIARRHGDRDVEMIARVGTGRGLIKSGEVERGLELLDEASAAAVCGELRPARPVSSTASRSAPPRASATSGVRPSGRRRRTAGATGWRSPAFRALAGCIAPRRCGCEATGPARSGRRRRRATSCRTSSARSPAAATTRSARSSATGQLRGRRRGLCTGERARPGLAAGAQPAPALAGQGRCRGRRHPPALARPRSALAAASPAGPGRGCDRRGRH